MSKGLSRRRLLQASAATAAAASFPRVSVAAAPPATATTQSLIAAAQKVEHYEIAGYGTVRAYAQQLGFVDAVGLLQQTLDEEGDADKKLTELAEAIINVEAEHAGT